ncbi:MAG TPA: hypothetical protein VGK50_06590 [Coriobacteriia bacterium]|jgi:hypothetical protein
MKTQTLVPVEDHRFEMEVVGDAMRRLLEQDGVKRVSVRDTRGHTVFEVPVRADEVAFVMEPIVAATNAVSQVVGDMVLRVETEGELPAEGGTRASMRERERADAQRQATGTEMQNGVTPDELALGDTGIPPEVRRR